MSEGRLRPCRALDPSATCGSQPLKPTDRTTTRSEALARASKRYECSLPLESTIFQESIRQHAQRCQKTHGAQCEQPSHRRATAPAASRRLLTANAVRRGIWRATGSDRPSCAVRQGCQAFKVPLSRSLLGRRDAFLAIPTWRTRTSTANSPRSSNETSTQWTSTSRRTTLRRTSR